MKQHRSLLEEKNCTAISVSSTVFRKKRKFLATFYNRVHALNLLLRFSSEQVIQPS